MNCICYYADRRSSAHRCHSPKFAEKTQSMAVSPDVTYTTRMCSDIPCAIHTLRYRIRPLPTASDPELMQYSTQMPSILPGYHHNAWKHHSHMVAMLYCQAWRVEAAALQKRATYCQITEMPLENTELPRSDCRVCRVSDSPRSKIIHGRRSTARS